MSLFEQIYGSCPVSVQNLATSLYGYYWKWHRFGGEHERTVTEFLERDRWPTDRMRDYLNSELQKVLQRALGVPYYRETWQEKGIGESHLREITLDTMHRLPIVAKEDVRRTPMAFVSDQIPSLTQVRSIYTSGSTGTPIRVVISRKVHQRLVGAREVRSFGWAGTSIKQSRAMIGGRPVVPRGDAAPPFYRRNIAEKQVYFSAYHISPANIANYVEGFNRYRPEVVTGYAFSQFLVARLMEEHSLSLDYVPAAAITSSEKLTQPMKDVILRSWGCRSYEEYGASENCGLATECEHGRLHVSPDFGIIELVDDDGMPVPPGVEGRILCTGLLNDVQYLVRYDIGDVGVWSDEPCPCGRNHLPVLKEIIGRLEDVVIGPDGRMMVRFHWVFVNLPHVLKGQIVQQDMDRFVVRVVANEGFGTEQHLEIRRRFEEHLGQVEVEIEQVSQLERDAHGKYHAVISRLNPSGLSN